MVTTTTRSSLGTTTGTTTTTARPSTSSSTTIPWTTARCHRLLRPLSAKLQALRGVIQRNPSAVVAVNNGSAGTGRTRPKRDERDPDALFVEVVEAAAGAAGAGAGGARRQRARVRRTYGGGGSGGARRGERERERERTAGESQGSAAMAGGVNDYLSIWGDGPTASTATDANPNQPRKPHRAVLQDPNSPLALLNSLKPVLDPSIFSLYLGIYTSLESILHSTRPPPSSRGAVLPLRTLAARKIAHCILATSSDADPDDIWYDAVSELGSSGEYLRDVVRWHCIELIRDAAAEGLLDARRGQGGVGMASVLIGLCRATNAEQEALSLLQTLFDLNPVIASAGNPAVVTLRTFFADTPGVMYRVLEQNFPDTAANPSWLGSSEIHSFLLAAVAAPDVTDSTARFTTRALAATFGLWTLPPPAHACSIPAKIGLKAETIILKITRTLLPLSHRPGAPSASTASTIMQTLLHGLLSQPPSTLAATETLWGPRYPIASKITILLRGLGTSASTDREIGTEVQRALTDVCSTGGKEALHSLAAFVADCYAPLYPSSRGAELRAVAMALLALAGARDGDVPGVVRFTPGRRTDGAAYLLAQLALQVAVAFSAAAGVRGDEEWVEWMRRLEARVVGMKMQTPRRVERRKGWRYEEGLDLWVAVGATPGRRRGGGLEVCVPPMRLRREEYDVVDDEEHDIAVEEEENNEGGEGASGISRMSTPVDSDEEFYSTIRMSPPRTLRRSPRNTERIRKSLRCFNVAMSSPVFTRLGTPAKRGRGAFWERGEESPVAWRGGKRKKDSDDEGWGEETEAEEEEEEDEEEEAAEIEAEWQDQDEEEEQPANEQEEEEEVEEEEVEEEEDEELEQAKEQDEESESEEWEQLSNPQDNSEEVDIPMLTLPPLPPTPSHSRSPTTYQFLHLAIHTTLPLSSPPPPTPPPLPRRPNRISLGALKANAIIRPFSHTPPISTTATVHRTPSTSTEADAKTPKHGRAVTGSALRKLEKSVKRRKRGKKRRRLERLVCRDDGLSADELGM